MSAVTCPVCGASRKVVTPEGVARVDAHHKPGARQRKWTKPPACPGSLREVAALG